jgi:hypothetical protein
MGKCLDFHGYERFKVQRAREAWRGVLETRNFYKALWGFLWVD